MVLQQQGVNHWTKTDAVCLLTRWESVEELKLPVETMFRHLYSPATLCRSLKMITGIKEVNAMTEFNRNSKNATNKWMNVERKPTKLHGSFPQQYNLVTFMVFCGSLWDINNIKWQECLKCKNITPKETPMKIIYLWWPRMSVAIEWQKDNVWTLNFATSITMDSICTCAFVSERIIRGIKAENIDHCALLRAFLAGSSQDSIFFQTFLNFELKLKLNWNNVDPSSQCWRWNRQNWSLSDCKLSLHNILSNFSWNLVSRNKRYHAKKSV